MWTVLKECFHASVCWAVKLWSCQCSFFQNWIFDCSSFSCITSKEFLCDENLERYLIKQGILSSHRCVQHTCYIFRPAHLAPVSLVPSSSPSLQPGAGISILLHQSCNGEQTTRATWPAKIPAWLNESAVLHSPVFLLHGWCFPSVKLLIFLCLKPLLPIRAYQWISKISALGEGLCPK